MSAFNHDQSERDQFIGTDELRKRFREQLDIFEGWNTRGDWLAFHHHHYDWWMFPIDEVSSQGHQFTLTREALDELLHDHHFVSDLRRGVSLMVKGWGWDIEQGDFFPKLDKNQKWSYWPVRLYKAGKCMWLFRQNDYYQSLKALADHVKTKKKEKLDYFSHTKNSKADVLEAWREMENSGLY